MKLNRIKAVLVEQDKSQKWLAEQLGKSAGKIYVTAFLDFATFKKFSEQ